MFQNSILEGWKVLSTKDAMLNLQFALFPLFHYRELEIIIENILQPIWTMKQYFEADSNVSVGTGESVLICGPVGVGKTTIQVSLFTILFLLTDFVLPVYVDFGESLQQYDKNGHSSRTSAYYPLSIAKDMLLTLQKNELVSQFPVSEDLLVTLFRMKLMLVFFSDEIQSLYISSLNKEISLERRTLCQNIIFQIAKIGKASGHIGVASGSSKTLQKFAFHPKGYNFDGYQTLNNSVYVPNNIHPCRDKDMFRQLVLTKKGLQSIEDKALVENFLVSGGIGRLIGLKRADNGYPEEYFDHLLFRTIVNQMVLKVKGSLPANARQQNNGEVFWDPWDHPHSIELSKCMMFAESLFGVSNGKQEFDKLIDTSLLLVHMSNVELVVPQQLQMVLQNAWSEGHNRFEEMSFEGTLLGWSDNRQVVFPSAGHCNEEPIRRMLSIKLDATYDPTPISITSIDVNEIEQYLNKLFQGLSHFLGIDGFLIRLVDGKYHVIVTQIKTGRLDLEIKLGQSAASKDTFLQYLSAMLQGYKTLVSYFPANEQTKFVLDEMIFVTTKKLHNKVLEYVSKPANFSYNDSPYVFSLYEQDTVLENVDIDSQVKMRLQERLQDHSP